MPPVLIIYPGGPIWNVYENVKRTERKSSYSSSAYIRSTRSNQGSISFTGIRLPTCSESVWLGVGVSVCRFAWYSFQFQLTLKTEDHHDVDLCCDWWYHRLSYRQPAAPITYWDDIFTDDIFKCIFMNENVWISLKISLTYVPKVRINNITSLVQILAWHRLGDMPLSEPIM